MDENKGINTVKEFTIAGEKVMLKPLSADFAHLAFDLTDPKTNKDALHQLIKETFKHSGYDFSKYTMAAVSDAALATLEINGLNKE